MAQATVHFVTRVLEDTADGRPLGVSEPLLFPELTALGHSALALRQRQLELAEDLLEKFPLDEPSRRLAGSVPELVSFEVEVAPAEKSEAWSEPLPVTLEAAVWSHGKEAKAGWIPALGVAVVATGKESLPDMLKAHALSAIRRRGYSRSLLHMALISRGACELHATTWNLPATTPKDRWLKRNAGKQSALDTLTSKLTAAVLPPAWEVEKETEQLAKLLSGKDGPSVLLVGAAGTGKTALVHQLVRRASAHGLGGKKFHRTSGARLVAGATGFGMWQQRCRELVECARGSVVLVLGNLFELSNVGQSNAGSESIASFLRPYLVRREVQVICEVTPEQLALIEKDDPRLIQAFRQMRIDEPDEAKLDRILTAESIHLGGRKGPPRAMSEALGRIAVLHRRYVRYAAAPGAPVRFLQRLHEALPKDITLSEADVFTTFAAESGMPLSLLDHHVPLDTAEVSRWLGRKVRGQQRAVETVTGVIARIKSGLSRPGRPLASFLFTGPTGTGKTEMAKALASWLFGSSERLIRLDMSEYGQPWSAQRLVSGAHRGNEGILTAAVREQPFSVLLLDEFEKAHPAVFDLLLQVLGEARLTDAAGRTADFSNCVVIMTSNLGAEEFGKPRLGFATDGGLRDATEHFTEAVRRTLRPEMFNRIDSIVPYLPLDKVTVRELTLREIAAAAERPGLAADRISLEVSPLLVDALAAEGFDPRYGARPLKRRVAERLLAPVAAHLAEGLPPETRIIADAAPDGRVRLSILRPQHDRAEQTGRGAMWERVHAAWRLRRTTERLRRSSMVSGLTGQLRRIEREQLNARKLQRPRNRKAETATWEPPDARRDALRRLLTRVNETADAALQWEEEIMLAAATDEPQAVLALPECPVHIPDTEDLLLDVHMAWEPPPHALLMVLQASSGQTLMEFVRIYRTLAREFGGTCAVGIFYRKTPAKLLSKSGAMARVDAPVAEEDQLKLLETDPATVACAALWITGPRAVHFLRGEAGLHICDESRKSEEPKKRGKDKEESAGEHWRCHIRTQEPHEDTKDLSKFTLPLEDLAAPDLEDGRVRRVWDPARHLMRDGLTNLRSSGPEVSFSVPWLRTHLRQLALDAARAG